MFPISDDNPRYGTPFVTWVLIGLNALAFFYELSLSPEGLNEFLYLNGMVPARYTDPKWAAEVGFPDGSYVPFFSSMFLHAGWMHLIGNMWTLWIFGDNVEDRMGHGRFLVFYLLCGFASGGLHFATNLSSIVPAVGASGAIAGVLGAYLILFPHARVIALVPILFYPLFIQLPAFFYLGFWFLTQILSGTASLASSGAAGGVAWWAHIGGFVAGVLLFRLFLREVPTGRHGRDSRWLARSRERRW